MYKNNTFLAIIPARGGSKRLPRKNVLDLNGKPLIAWSIEAGLKSKYIDRVIVSSDDTEILDISQYYGADIIQRPEILANDTAKTFGVIKHVIENSDSYSYIVLLQPTSPLRTSQHIDKAIELLVSERMNTVISVCKMDHSPLWSNTLPEDESLNGFLSENVLNKRSQDLEIYYRLNGAIYICNTDRLLEERTFFLQEKSKAFKMDREISIDIDEEIDYLLAKFIMKKNTKGIGNEQL